MLTNLVVVLTVAVTTNVTERFPQHLVADNHLWATNTINDAVFYGHWENDPNPREKWITTNVCEVQTLAFTFAGDYREVKFERPLTNWTTHFVKTEDWAQTGTNIPPLDWYYFPAP